MEPDHREQRCRRPKAFDKMEALVREMQDTESGGVPVRSQKIFLTSIPAAFMGYDLIEWLIMRLEIEESEALNIANQLCQYGYFFPISDSKNLVVKDDSSLYRFQSPFYWPWRNKPPDNVDYAIYLMKRSLRNKQRHGLEEYEMEAFTNLKRNLSNKWDIITTQAEEQVKHQKSMKKPDKLISDSQEKAYWRVHRPPPGITSSLEQVPIPARSWKGLKPRKKTIEDCKREVELMKTSLYRTRIKVSQALENIVQHVELYSEFDPLLTPPQPSNPWVNEDVTFWQLNAPLVDIPSEKRVRKWGLSLEDLLSDPTGVQEFTNYLEKEKSEENILFWLTVNDLRRSSQSQILWKIQELFENYLKHGSPREVNIDNQTMDKVLEGMKNNSRFCFDAAQEHVYNLLLKKDCYPRFIRSDYYKNLLSNGVQPLQKKRFFGFGPTKKKSTTSQPISASSQYSSGGSGAVPNIGALNKRRGSDRSLSGSAHEISHFGVNIIGTHSAVIKETNKVPHSHSQSNLSDIPYRIKKPNIVAGTSTSEEVCPWEVSSAASASTTSAPKTPIKNRKTSNRLDSESSSSDISSIGGVHEITEKVQRNLLTQQHTLDCGKKLLVDNFETPRRASVSVPIYSSSGSSSTECGSRRKVSSFEDNSSSSCNVASTSSDSCSATLVVIKSDNNNKHDVEIAGDHSTPTTSSSSNKENNKLLQKSNSIAKSSPVNSAGAGAPIIISVSSATDEDFESSEEKTPRRITWEESFDQPGPSQADYSLLRSFPEELKANKAPLAEPDGESPASELPPSEIPDIEEEDAEEKLLNVDEKKTATSGATTTESEEGAATNTEVCPWEDEESCKVNTPFVKKYATLGYL